MFQPFRRLSYQVTHSHLRPFIWLIVTILGGVLVASATLAPAFAAGPSVYNRPLLKVVPKQVGIPGDGINCKGYIPNVGSICHVTLTEVKSSSTPLNWITRSDLPATFNPSHGHLTPGQSVQVTITTAFCGGYTNFYFVGPKNVATVTFQCG